MAIAGDYDSPLSGDFDSGLVHETMTLQPNGQDGVNLTPGRVTISVGETGELALTIVGESVGDRFGFSAAVVIYAIMRPDAFEDQLDHSLFVFDQASRETEPTMKKVLVIEGTTEFSNYIRNFLLDDTALNIILFKQVYEVLDEGWQY